MADYDSKTQLALPGNNLVTITHVVYGLHAFSAIVGLTTAAFIVTAFLTGWPSIIAVIINYVKRNDVKGTYLESHFAWQIRTFWWALLWLVLAFLVSIPLVLIIIGIPLAWALFVIIGIWVLYRITRGWLALLSNKPMPM
ncbi:MAG: hypothetical protein FJY56_06385 [Betaproteobacteria bacterium]|nr:hypothetical protein [Betaproteobacteria bacterium]